MNVSKVSLRILSQGRGFAWFWATYCKRGLTGMNPTYVSTRGQMLGMEKLQPRVERAIMRYLGEN
jgi:hypothetical protein